MKIDYDIKLDFDDVYIKPQPTELESRSQVNLNVSYLTKHSKKRFIGLPVLVANMDKIGVPNMAKALYDYKIGVCLHKHYSIEKLLDILNQEWFKYSFISFGISDIDIEKIQQLSKYNLDINICLDIANGYMYSFLDKIKYVRELYPNAIIMAGNVATPEGVENLIKSGADIVKCGIAQGSKCDTKNKAGVGYPQLSVAIECGKTANELNALCCSDGGVKNPGDICKALGAGSHIVMCGGLFFGYEENETNWEYEHEIDNGRYVWTSDFNEALYTGKKRMLAYGMSSKIANDKFFGGLKNYRTSEGKEVYVDHKGNVADIAKDIRGSLTSACTYSNVKNLENLHKKCLFVRSGV